jgi:NitT/TauT family transport system substrate-binding protein
MSTKLFDKSIVSTAAEALGFIERVRQRITRHLVNKWAKLLPLILAVMLSACGSAPTTPALTSVTLQLRWTHQAQFAGYYAADQNGYYAEEGLAVSFLEGGPNVDTLPPVLSGAAQFGLANMDILILARAEGKPVRAVATDYRRWPGVYISLADSDIRMPQDFVGKTIAVGRAGRPVLNALMTRVGISPDQYTVVDSTPDLTQLYSGEVQVRSVFLTNEVLAARAAGYELNLIFPDDYGIHAYNDILFTTDDLIANDSDLVRRFLRATLRGWTYAVENPTAIGPLVLKYNPDADVEHENDFMIASLPLINTGEDHIGWMKPEVWAGMEQLLREQNMLAEPLDVTQAYTLQFLQEIYP